MSITATLVGQGRNRLRFLLVCNTTGTTTLTIDYLALLAVIPPSAGPPAMAGSLKGPITNLINSWLNGYGALLAGGPQTQATARALFMNDRAGYGARIDSPFALGNNLLVTAQPALTYRTGTAEWTIDATVASPAGHANSPALFVTANNTGSAYLDVEVQGAIGN